MSSSRAEADREFVEALIFFRSTSKRASDEEESEREAGKATSPEV